MNLSFKFLFTAFKARKKDKKTIYRPGITVEE